MEDNRYDRRDFLGNLVKAGAAGVLTNPVLGHFTPEKNLTVGQIMDRIIKEVPGGTLSGTVDTLKSGSADQIVTGIVTSMFATIPVIRAAVKAGANFIIAHEPSFYNHADDEQWVANNPVLKEKKELLKKNQIAIWRFHDYWHRIKPDGILHGVLQKTGWLAYNLTESETFSIPPASLKTIIGQVKNSLQIPHLRYIGDPEHICIKLSLLPGAWGGQRQVDIMVKNNPDLLIVGEISEWETPEYIRDARALGSEISLLVLGHAYSEEPGMEWLVQWLKPIIPGVPVTHIESGEPFSWA